MDTDQAKADLHRYLRRSREALVWKLDGLSEYDVRRPMTRTGTNLLGLVKHAAAVQAGYLGDTFDRPFALPPPWSDDDAEPDADMWATADESRDDLVELTRRVWRHSDATIDALDLDAPGRVPWWGDRGDVTLQLILVHLVDELARHAGHADVIRELLDGAVGIRPGDPNIGARDEASWTAHRDRLDQVARDAAERPG